MAVGGKNDALAGGRFATSLPTNTELNFMRQYSPGGAAAGGIGRKRMGIGTEVGEAAAGRGSRDGEATDLELDADDTHFGEGAGSLRDAGGLMAYASQGNSSNGSTPYGSGSQTGSLTALSILSSNQPGSLSNAPGSFMGSLNGPGLTRIDSEVTMGGVDDEASDGELGTAEMDVRRGRGATRQARLATDESDRRSESAGREGSSPIEGPFELDMDGFDELDLADGPYPDRHHAS